MARLDKLKELYGKASVLDEDNPLQLMNKLSIYGQILELQGRFHSESVAAWKLAEMVRRETLASSMAYGAELEGAEPAKTAKEKEAVAEVIAAEKRKAEAIAEAEAWRWRNAYQSTIEQINIMKKRYDHLVNVYEKGGI
jgi:hypothetical protein